MEELNELEKRIIKEYVEKTITDISLALEVFSNSTPKEAYVTILNFIRISDNGKLNLILGNGESMLFDELSACLKDRAIREFLEKIDK